MGHRPPSMAEDGPSTAIRARWLATGASGGPVAGDRGGRRDGAAAGWGRAPWQVAQPVFWRPAAIPLTVRRSRRSSEAASRGPGRAQRAHDRVVGGTRGAGGPARPGCARRACGRWRRRGLDGAHADEQGRRGVPVGRAGRDQFGDAFGAVSSLPDRRARYVASPARSAVSSGRWPISKARWCAWAACHGTAAGLAPPFDWPSTSRLRANSRRSGMSRARSTAVAPTPRGSRSPAARRQERRCDAASPVRAGRPAAASSRSQAEIAWRRRGAERGVASASVDDTPCRGARDRASRTAPRTGRRARDAGSWQRRRRARRSPCRAGTLR